MSRFIRLIVTVFKDFSSAFVLSDSSPSKKLWIAVVIWSFSVGLFLVSAVWHYDRLSETYADAREFSETITSNLKQTATDIASLRETMESATQVAAGNSDRQRLLALLSATRTPLDEIQQLTVDSLESVEAWSNDFLLPKFSNSHAAIFSLVTPAEAAKYKSKHRRPAPTPQFGWPMDQLLFIFVGAACVISLWCMIVVSTTRDAQLSSRAFCLITSMASFIVGSAAALLNGVLRA